MTTPVQLAYKNLLLVCMACAQLWAQAQTAAPAPAPSPTLASLVRDALDSHPTTQSQRALVASAAAGVESARWQFYPTPSVSLENATTSGTDPSYQGDNRVATLRLQQPLYTGGRLTAGADKAQASLDQSQAALEESRLQLSLRVVQAYGEWLSAHLKVQASQKNEDTHNRLLRQVQRRIEEGVSAESDRVLALGRLDAVRAEVTATQVQGDMALARLGQLLGRPIVGAALTRTVATPRPVSALTAALLEQALGQSAALQKAQSQVRVQEATVVERRADLLPEIYLRAERQYGNFNFANGAPVNRFFVGVSSRLGAGLSGLSNVAAARSQLEAALAEVQVQTRNLIEQVLADHAQFMATERRLASMQASLRSAQSVSESFDRQFLAGRKTWLDVMNAARELAQTEAQIADLLSTQVVVSWRLSFYTQGIEAVTQGTP
ncbi:TolC family protein [Limnohabitans sp. Rim8]|uniref:TolC family protein n=1 Tax=Limnohabitans sp. Rim8 TaxID=1100718 RepID=UPI002600F58F|nr:TolC family protein [Limnohabitans sp. Rim8]